MHLALPAPFPLSPRTPESWGGFRRLGQAPHSRSSCSDHVPTTPSFLASGGDHCQLTWQVQGACAGGSTRRQWWLGLLRARHSQGQSPLPTSLLLHPQTLGQREEPPGDPRLTAELGSGPWRAHGVLGVGFRLGAKGGSTDTQELLPVLKEPELCRNPSSLRASACPGPHQALVTGLGHLLGLCSGPSSAGHKCQVGPQRPPTQQAASQGGQERPTSAVPGASLRGHGAACARRDHRPRCVVWALLR